jgi:2-polyprenyl-3-methyl-5-hydroxy-6-metoxy-1,4-benzoquinol methylase
MKLGLLFKKPQHWIASENLYCRIDAEGISTSYTPEMTDRYFEVEDTSWWFRFRSKVVLQSVRKFFRNTPVVDIGGGNGYNTKILQREGYEMVLLEPSYQACLNAQKRGITNIICGTINDEDYNENSIAACCILDVLEHIENDFDFLRTLKNKLITDGRILLTVPAFMALWSSEDKAVGHFRRYTKAGLTGLVESAGFEVIYATYFFSFLYFPVLFVRRLGERFGLMKKYETRSESKKVNVLKQQHTSQQMLTKIVLKQLERMELKKMLRGKKICIGTSILMVAKKSK